MRKPAVARVADAATAPSATVRPVVMDPVAALAAMVQAVPVPVVRVVTAPAVRDVMAPAVVHATGMTAATNRAVRLPPRCRTSM